MRIVVLFNLKEGVDPEFQKVAAAFGAFADNPQFILTEAL